MDSFNSNNGTDLIFIDSMTIVMDFLELQIAGKMTFRESY